MNCADCKEILVEYIEGLLDESRTQEVAKHLNDCPGCKAELISFQSLKERIVKNGKAVAQSNLEDKVLGRILRELRGRLKAANKAGFTLKIWRIILGSRAGSLAAAFIIISSLGACLILSRKNTNLRDELAQRDAAIAQNGDSVTINFYLKEHQEFIAQQASLNSAEPQPVEMQISPDDILYYEFLDDELEFMNPGIIVRGPSFQSQVSLPETPAISNGNTLTLTEARMTTDFDLVAPARLYPGHSLDQIRKIEGRDALQLLYNDGINSISLFEQPLDGQRGLSHQDIREYAVYNNLGESRGTILAWRDETLSYVLIGNIEISQLMDMAQSINATK